MYVKIAKTSSSQNSIKKLSWLSRNLIRKSETAYEKKD